MRFHIEPVYCITWIWTLHRAHNKSKSPIEEDNIWASCEPTKLDVWSLININIWWTPNNDHVTNPCNKIVQIFV